MPQFDVYRTGDGGMVLDCQADVFDRIGTRFVVPLMPVGEAAPDTPRLHPRFEVNGEPMIMMTEFATAIRTVELRSKACSMAHERFRIIGAIDVLLSGI